jgi:hypothetical protein
MTRQPTAVAIGTSRPPEPKEEAMPSLLVHVACGPGDPPRSTLAFLVACTAAATAAFATPSVLVRLAFEHDRTLTS